MIKRYYHYCDQWHFDYQYSQQSQIPNYSILIIDQEMSGSVSDNISSSHIFEDESSATTAFSFHNIPASQFINIFFNDIQYIENIEIKLTDVNKFIIDEILSIFYIDIDVFYLIMKLCPIKAWVDEISSSDIFLKSDVADFGSLILMIDRNILIDNVKLLQISMNLIFQEFGKNRIMIEDYIVISIYLPRITIMINDMCKV
jgi:hypothetical protein